MRVGNFATVSDIKAYIICLYLSKMVQFFWPTVEFQVDMQTKVNKSS